MSEEELNKITWEEYKRLIEESEITYNELQEATKEIERLNNIIKEQGLEDKPNYYVKGLEGSLKEYQEEVKRLNNIINEFDKWLIKQQIEEGEFCDFLLENKQIKVKEVLDKLQELKGSRNNE